MGAKDSFTKDPASDFVTNAASIKEVSISPTDLGKGK